MRARRSRSLCCVSRASAKLCSAGVPVARGWTQDASRTALPSRLRRPAPPPPPPRRGPLARAFALIPALLLVGLGWRGRSCSSPWRRSCPTPASSTRRADRRGCTWSRPTAASIAVRGASGERFVQLGRDLALAGRGGDRDRGQPLPPPFRHRPGRPRARGRRPTSRRATSSPAAARSPSSWRRTSISRPSAR